MTPFNEAATMRKVYGRLMPLLFAMMFFNYLDRINIGFAALDMNKELGFSPAVFGFAGSIFFVGYMVLEVPSNLMLHRVSAPARWIARILLTWGAVAAATAFVFNDTSFYVLRFLLGVMEAGFLPGIARLSDKMVSAALPGARGGRLHHCGFVLRGARRSDLDRADDLRERHSRPAGLAMDVHPRRRTGDAARPPDAAHHDRASGRCELAHRRRKALARIDARRRTRSRRRQPAFPAAARGERHPRLEPRLSVRLRAGRHLRAVSVAAADRQESGSAEQYRGRLSVGRAAAARRVRHYPHQP